MITPFLVYKLYLAIKLHFTTDTYDVVKSRGRVRASEKAFNQRRDLHGIRRLARKYKSDDVIEFLVANFTSGDSWGGLFDIESEKRYKDWKARMESLSYQYTQDLIKLCESVNRLDALFDTKNGKTHPPILRAYLSGAVTLETLVILEKVLPYVDDVSKYLHNDIVWPGIERLIRKYSPFVRFPTHKYIAITSKVVQTHFLEEIE